MPDSYIPQSSFQKGEISPRLHSRVDSPLFRQGAAIAKNLQVMVQGGLRKRSGTRYVSKSIRHRTLNGSVLVPDDDPSGTRDANQTNTTLVDFVFSQQQSYVIEFGHEVMRFYTLAGRVNTNPSEPDSRLHLAYEVAHPYSADEIDEIDWVQSADVMYFTHRNHPVHKLIRRSETNWEMNSVEFAGGPWMDLYTGNDNNLFPDQRPNPPNSNIPNLISDINQTELKSFAYANPFGNRFPTQIEGFVGWDWLGAKHTVTGIALRAKERTGTDQNDFAGNNHVTGWRFDGWSDDKNKWVQIFRRIKDTGYGNTEERAFFWPKKTTQNYTKHRWFIESHANYGGDMSGVRLQISGVEDVIITFENTDGINDDAGFNNDDVGRLIRYRDGGGYWAIFKIVTVLNPTQIKGTLDAMQQLGSSADWGSSIWQLGAFSEKSGYPSTCTIYQERLCLASTKAQPRSVFMSVATDYENFFIPDPLTDDAPITITLSGSRQDKINWMREMSDLMMIGTTDSISSIGGTSNEPLSPTNIVQRAQTWAGASEEVFPARVARSLFFVGTHGKNLHELSYTDLAAAFDAPPISQVNEHLYRHVVKGLAYSHDVDSVLMSYDELGELAWMTYEKVQNVAGAAPIMLGGVSKTLSMTVIPEDLEGYQGESFYFQNERELASGTVHYIERLEPPWEDGVETDMWFADCALRYDGPAVDQITGLYHLAGEEVVVLGWNETLGATATDPIFSTETFIVAADGTLELPSPMTRAVIGYAYEARLKLLPFFPGQLGRTGSPLGRKTKADGLIVDMYRTRAILAKSGSGFLREEEMVLREDQDPMDAYPPLFTGFKRVYLDDSWDESGQLEIYSEQPFPMFVRSVTPIIDLEGS